MREPAIVLLAHGSPDPDWTASVRRTQAALQARMPEHAVRVATLGGEHDTGLAAIVDALAAAGHRQIVVTALFLSAGGKHVKRDIPELVATLAEQRPALTLTLTPGALGDDPQVAQALAAAAQRAVAATGPSEA